MKKSEVKHLVGLSLYLPMLEISPSFDKKLILPCGPQCRMRFELNISANSQATSSGTLCALGVRTKKIFNMTEKGVVSMVTDLTAMQYIL